MSVFKKIAILGPGLLGASVALAARKYGAAQGVSLWGRRVEALEELATRGVGDAQSTQLEKVVQGADLVILATPIGAMASLAEKLVNLSWKGVVTDVGSVKGVVVDELQAIFKETGIEFVGSHPMAGSEKSGAHYASADLFAGAICIVTPSECNHVATLHEVQAFWECCGARVMQLTPYEHDTAVARISHLPHVAAAALLDPAVTVGGQFLEFCGSGLKDTTRIAAGSPEMWLDILLENREAVGGALRDYCESLKKFAQCLKSGDRERVLAFLQSSQETREGLD